MTLGTFFGDFLFTYAASFILSRAISGLYSLFIRYVI